MPTKPINHWGAPKFRDYHRRRPQRIIAEPLQAIIKNEKLNLFKKKTELDILRKEFCFLENDFGYSLITDESKSFYKGKNLLIYRNESAEKQIEICGGGSFFHCIIRRINQQELATYSNRVDNIGFEDLAIIDNPKYDHFDFYAGGSTGVNGVTENTVALFKSQKRFLTNKDWIDLSRVESLKNGLLRSRFKPVVNNKPEFFIAKVKAMIDTEYKDFNLTFYNEELPFYHEDSTLEKLHYQWNGQAIRIEQYDWRDYQEIYSVFLNDNKIKEIDTSRFKNQDGAIEEIKKACNEVYSA